VDDSISSDVLSSQWRMDSGLWDEAATKMDLARAYVEMEDPDAARAILEEVAQEGNEAQQAEAKAMLAKLD
jgi:pilus assembly protein FimV